MHVPSRPRIWTLIFTGLVVVSGLMVGVPIAYAATYHVNNQSSTCSDTGPGTLSQPWCTIRKAVSAAVAPGDVITLHTGTYREGVTITKSDFILQAAPGETVIIKGSDIVTGWTQEPGRAVWTRTGPQPQGFVQKPIVDGYPVCNPKHPRCRFPYQVFVDEQPLTQVAPETAPGPGQFSYHPETHVWRLGSDPTGKTVEVAVRQAWMAGDGRAAGVTIRGFQFRHASSGAQRPALHDGPPRHLVCAPPPGQQRCAGRDLGQGWVFEANDIAWAHGFGLSLHGDYAVVRNNRIHDNGHLGLDGLWNRYVLVEGNTIFGNNTAGYNFGWVAGGLKAVGVQQWQIVANVVHDNNGYGMLCDIACTDIQFEGNRVYGNRAWAGLSMEISWGGTMAHNLVYDNAGAGILLFHASGIIVRDNVLARNTSNLQLLQVARPVTDARANTFDNILHDNTLIGDAQTRNLIWVQDQNHFGVITKNTTDRNKIYHFPTHHAWFLWGGAYASPNALCATRRQECNSTVLTSAQAQQILTANGIPSSSTPPPPFTTGDRVQATNILNVQSTPGGTKLGQQERGARGTVVAGPTTADSHTWWKIDYDREPDGWSIENYLVKVRTTP